ncbi:hypothetical protein GP486_001839 [Trichoglossum hirsutum]|uniref:Uncharacterized protein n=1 Tax=Trichoglossum hirsutum TaxID=265104 RepID=A0A9P8LGC4_9PEZI|nr:hypothetical protein GP486_001839 [Trichoglossum hirsutum]
MSVVEANSLSSLTALSSSPPKYPRNPTLEVRDPLILYIARVPGSKDIFLTTLKPHQKTVTAEDVTNSLYYMHVNEPENDSLQDTEGTESSYSQEIRNRTGKELNRVERKPIPSDPQSSSHDRLEPPSRDSPNYQHSRSGSNGQAQVSRKPVAGSTGKAIETEAGLATSSPLQMRPLGPRPIGYESRSMGRPSGLENLPPSHQVERRPVPPPRPGSGIRPDDYSLPTGPNENSSKHYESPTGNDSFKSGSTANVPPQRSHQSLDTPAYPRRSDLESAAPKAISITLIRRDPSSGGQWNVGNIAITPALDGPLPSKQQYRPSSYVKSGMPPRRISVEITNPGYGKFLPPKRPPLYPTPASEGRVSLGDGEESVRWKDFAYQNISPIQAPTESNIDVSDETFRREVWIEGAGFWDLNLRKGGSDSIGADGTASFSASNTDSPSSGVGESERSRFDDSDSTPQRSSETGISSAKSMAKKEVFISPWNGRCEFSTGAGGRSLKCKHTLPTFSAPAQVSELRFNLPVPSAFGGNRSAVATGPSSSETNRSSVFSQSIRKHLLSHHRRRSRSESPPTTNVPTKPNDYSGDVDNARPGLDRRLSIELGQEKAGGGPTGKRTKLGKLIVEDEGQRMLDLIVAVNMGIWWRAWERIDHGNHFIN